MRTASDTLKRLSLELAGQCPFVVLDDANLEEAAAAAARRSFSNMGQICIAVNRIIVVESISRNRRRGESRQRDDHEHWPWLAFNENSPHRDRLQ
jgi:acyl-CoA reductase-like NAD-dependent aldehyde dehydrogenase